MTEQSYTGSQITALKQSNPFLAKSAAEKYAKYKSTDPFPKVGEALLNSADLLMYLLTVGIVEPFDEGKLKGVTYQCTFSGEAHYFDLKTDKMKEIHLSDDGELVLPQNSITYLKIEEKFHVPEYMALRFNLSVSNAYKGLLLGTGPIVDPGFEGNLFIPLHNLTGNEYIIKKGAPLIRVEFTKLSRHAAWGNKKPGLFEPIKPITKKTPQNADFSSFFEEALLDPGRRKFYASGATHSVRSSIPDAIEKSAGEAEEAQKSAADAASKADEAQKSASDAANKAEEAQESAADAASKADEAQKSAADAANQAQETQKSAATAANEAKKARKTARRWSIAGWITTAIAVATVAITSVGIAISSYSLVHDAHVRYDGMAQDIEACKQQICTLTKQLETARAQLEQYETIRPQDNEQGIEQETSVGTAPLPPSSSDEAGEGSDGS